MQGDILLVGQQNAMVSPLSLANAVGDGGGAQYRYRDGQTPGEK